MSERRFEVRPYGVDYICDKCGNGLMMGIEVAGGIALLSSRPKFRHVCSSCGHEDFLSHRYPTIRWENLGAES
jgi:predicted RNA-binding Zn-ribbon protein involved in translation (DUF1610 family)